MQNLTVRVTHNTASGHTLFNGVSMKLQAGFMPTVPSPTQVGENVGQPGQTFFKGFIRV